MARPWGILINSCGKKILHSTLFRSMLPLPRNANPKLNKDLKSLGLQEVKCPRIPRQSAHESGKAVSATRRPPLPPRRYPWYSFLLDAEP